MKKTLKGETYYVNSIATFQKVPEGVRTVWMDDGNYAWGEFIADADFNFGEFDTVQFEATDFSNLDPYYQRGITEQVSILLMDRKNSKQ